MRTDPFFWNVLTSLPQTLFEVLGEPSSLARDYQFSAVELKKSLRTDGFYRPRRAGLPMYVVEFQFYVLETFYANLFAKVFVILNDQPNISDWVAVAIFESRGLEPKDLTKYEDLLRSKRVKRIYLDELELPAEPSPGLMLLAMVTAPKAKLRPMVERLKRKAEEEVADDKESRKVIELMEELLIRKFATMNREEIRNMFQLTDIRKTVVWQEAREEGLVEGIEKGIEKG